MELFKLLGTIAIDNSKANQGIDETTEKASQSESKMSKAFAGIGSAAAKVGKVVAVGVGAASTAMAGLTTKAMNLAGELEQNMGGSEAVFKDSAAKMQKTAQTAFNNMGLSTSNFLATANKMGALFQGAGFDIEASADMSADAMQRAADVASIMGIDVDAAMEAVAGMAKGNFTMMDNLGVAINDTTLQIFAQEKGLGKLETTQQKVNAAYQLFMEKSEYAKGNYAKENETFAGALTTAKAALENFLSGAGSAENLADAFVSAGSVITEKLQELLPKLVSGLKILIDKLVPELPGLLKSLLPSIIEGAVALLNGLIASLPTLLQIIIQQIPFIFSQIGQALVETFPVLMQTIKDLTAQIVDAIGEKLFGVSDASGKAFSTIGDAFDKVCVVMQDIWDAVGQPIFDAVQDAIGIAKDMFAEYMPQIQGFVSACFGDIKVLWENNLKPCLNAIGDFIENVLAPIFKGVFEGYIKSYIQSAFTFVKNMWEGTLKPVFTGITDFLTGVFTLNFGQAMGGIGSMLKGIVNGWISSIEWFVNGAINALNGLFGGINGLVDSIGDKVGLNLQIPTISTVSLPRLAKGGVLEKGQIGLLEGDGAEAVVPLENNSRWIARVAQDMQAQGVGGNTETLNVLKEILMLLEELRDEGAEMLLDAMADGLKFNINNREFARLVKAVN